MEQAVKAALEKDRLIDITTKGRKSGTPRRKELGIHYLDGKVYLSGSPGRRSWYANLLASPDFTFHLKQSLKQDISARAIPSTDKARRHQVFLRMKAAEGERARNLDVEEWTAGSPLVEVELKLGVE